MTKSKKTDQKNVLDKWAIQHLYNEADHFYQAELSNEQRGSWLLGLNGALLAAFLTFGGARVQSVSVLCKSECRSTILIVSILAVAVFVVHILSCFFAISAICPWRGRRSGKFFWSKSDWNKQLDRSKFKSKEETAWKHYTRHRERSEDRALHVKRAIISTIAGLILWCSGIFVLFVLVDPQDKNCGHDQAFTIRAEKAAHTYAPSESVRPPLNAGTLVITGFPIQIQNCPTGKIPVTDDKSTAAPQAEGMVTFFQDLLLWFTPNNSSIQEKP